LITLAKLSAGQTEELSASLKYGPSHALTYRSMKHCILRLPKVNRVWQPKVTGISYKFNLTTALLARFLGAKRQR
jgi:hypothetical protein